MMFKRMLFYFGYAFLTTCLLIAFSIFAHGFKQWYFLYIPMIILERFAYVAIFKDKFSGVLAVLFILLVLFLVYAASFLLGGAR